MPSEISQFFVSMVLIAFFFTIVWLITRFLKPKSLEVTFDAPRKEAALAIVCVVAIFLTFAVVLAFIVRSAGRPLGTPEQFDLPGALRQWGIYAAISIIPTLVIIRIRKQGFQTVGATKKNFLLSFGIGNVLSMFLVLYVALAATPERFLYRFLDWNAFYAFISFLAVGFGEELMFRGFLQLRCSAWLGEIKGLILTSSIFALIHMP